MNTTWDRIQGVFPPISFIPLVTLLLITSSPALGQADNDAFARRVSISGSSAQVEAHVLNATIEPGEPDQEWLRGGTVWFTWTAPADGMLRLAGELGGTFAVLFEGDQLATLKAQAVESAGVGALYRVRGQTPYAIAIGTPTPAIGPTEPVVTLSLEFAALPLHDRFEGRLPLEGDTVEFKAWLAGATLDAGEPSLEPNGQLPTAWWHWTAPADGIVTLEALFGMCSAGAFRGNSLQNLTPLGAMPHPQIPVRFEVQAGVDYAIAVTGWGADPNLVRLSLARWMFAEGQPADQTLPQPARLDFALGGIPASETVTNLFLYDTGDLGILVDTNRLVDVHVPLIVAGRHEFLGEARCASGRRYTLLPLRLTVLHPNDDFATRPNLVGSPVEFVADTRGSTLDPGELVGVTGSVWWSWTAPQTGLAIVTLLSGGNVGIGLYQGTTPTTLTPVEGNLVVAGETYVIRGGPWTPEPGRFRLEILERPTPNDAFAGRHVVGPDDVWTLIDFAAATVEPGEPVDGAGPERASLWYRFTAPADGTVEFAGSPHQQFLVPYLYPGTVYQGESIESLQPVASQDGFTRFRVNSGRTYQLRLQRAFDNSGTVAWMHFHFAPAPANDAFASATHLAGERVGFLAGLDGASAELGEPLMNPRGIVPVRSRWWKWTAPHAGWAAWQIPQAAPGTQFWPFFLEVFEGDTFASLTPVTLTRLQWESRFFRAEESKTYLLRLTDLAGEGGLGPNEVAFRLDLSDLEIVTPAAGDPIPLPQGPVFTVRGRALAEAGTRVIYREQVGSAGGGIWDDLVMVEERGEGHGADGRFASEPIARGSHTYFALALGQDGSHSFAPPITFSVRPANDDFARLEEISGHHARAAGSTLGATLEPGEPPIGQAEASVWFSWTAPADGPVTVRAAGGTYVRAFRGNTLATLQDANPAAALAATETFTAIRGNVYRIAVAAVAGQAANFALSLDQTTLQWTSPPTNSVFQLGDPITFSITTTEAAEDVSRLVFRAGSTLVHDGAAPPYEIVWTDSVPGTHTLSSQLVLQSGEILTNTTRRIRVVIPNTTLAAALPIEDRQGKLTVDLRGSEKDPDAATASAWFRWVAPADGYLLLQTTNRSISSARVQFSVGTQPLTVLKTNGSLSLNGWTASQVTNGVTYNLRVAGTVGALMPPLLYELLERASNDAFQAPVDLIGSGLTTRALTLPATAETGEPAHGNRPAARSLWYRWTAPTKGLLSLTRTAAAALYTGDSLGELVRVAGTSSSGFNAGVEAGVIYRIAIDETGGTSPDVMWNLNFSPSPANDAFVNRTILTGRRVRFQASLSLATGEAGEPQPEGYTFGHTVWFDWTAPATGHVTLHTSPAARIAVFRGNTLDALTLLTYGVWDLAFQAVAGESYKIMFDTNGGAGPAATMVDLILDQPPANDAFADRMTLEGSSTTMAGWNIGAHRELFEPAHAGLSGGRSVWYRWRAPASGRATVTVDGDIAATLLAVYTGGSMQNLQPAANNAGSQQTAIEFDAVAGEDYALAVDGRLGAAGDFTLALNFRAAAPPPRLSIVGLATGSVRVTITGLAGRAGRLEVSSDLRHWNDGSPLPAGLEQTEITDPPVETARFYRVRLDP